MWKISMTFNVPHKKRGFFARGYKIDNLLQSWDFGETKYLSDILVNQNINRLASEKTLSRTKSHAFYAMLDSFSWIMLVSESLRFSFDSCSNWSNILNTEVRKDLSTNRRHPCLADCFLHAQKSGQERVGGVGSISWQQKATATEQKVWIY